MKKFTAGDSVLTDTSIGHLQLVPVFLYSLHLTLFKTDITFRRTFLAAGHKDVRLRET